MKGLTVTGKSISECVEEGAKQLGLTIDEVDQKIIEEGSKGFLGIGAKPAKVIVWKLGEELDEESEETPAPAAREEIKEEKSSEDTAVEETVSEVSGLQADESVKTENDEIQSQRDALTDSDKEEIINTASNFLKSVFEKMNLNAEIEAELVENKQLQIEIKGDNMGAVIGKRGQALDSLQYLTNLVVNKGKYPYMNVALDTEGYREKRKESLERLAFNLAKKAKHNRRNVTLEPMNPYERRIIHSTLQNDRYVTTFSEGAEPYRYVVIALKNGHTRGGSFHKDRDNEQK